jgi:hypothetical protein
MSRVREILKYKNPKRAVTDIFNLTISDVPLSQMSPLVALVHAFVEMDINLDVYGISRIYFEAEGEFAHELEAFCREHGVKKLAAYLGEANALFPNGKVPKDLQGRQRAEMKLSHREPDPFEPLDKKYKKHRADFYPALRDHLLASVEQLERDIGVTSAAAVDRKSVDSVLAEKDDVEFFSRLCGLVDPTKTAGKDNETPAAEVVTALDGLWLYGGNDGMWKFLSVWPVGRYLPNLVPWTKAVGSARASAYCAATVKLLPAGRVPVDDAFMKWIDKLEDAARQRQPSDKWYGVDALRRVDKEHAGALDDLAVKLRAFVRKNAADPIAAFGGVFKKSPARRPPKPKAPTRILNFEAALAKDLVEGAELLRLATERGLRRIDGKEDPRMTRFIDGLANISEAQWMKIAETFYTNSRGRRRALESISSLSAEMITGRIIAKEQATRITEPARAARERARAITGNLPLEPHPKGGRTDFQKLANAIMNDAWQGLMYIDFLAVTKEGQDALRTVGKPFVGLTELPPEMLPAAKGRAKPAT